MNRQDNNKLYPAINEKKTTILVSYDARGKKMYIKK